MKKNKVKKEKRKKRCNHLLPGDRPVPGMHLYVRSIIRVDTWDVKTIILAKNHNSGTPRQDSTRREYDLSRPQQSRERRARSGTTRKQRTESWYSSRGNSKTVRKLVSKRNWTAECTPTFVLISIRSKIPRIIYQVQKKRNVESETRHGVKVALRTLTFARVWYYTMCIKKESAA